MYIKRWCVLLTTSSPSCLRTVCGWGDGPSCLGRNSAVLSFASLLSISRFRVCHLRLSHHQHGLLHGVRHFLPKGSWDVSFPWLSYSRTLIIFGWLLFLNSSFKCGHFSRTCPQPLSRYPWVIPYTLATSHRQGGSSQISVSLLRSNTVFPSPHLLPCDINRIQPISNQKHYSFSYTSLHLFYLLGPLACKAGFQRWGYRVILYVFPSFPRSEHRTKFCWLSLPKYCTLFFSSLLPYFSSYPLSPWDLQ